MPIISFCARPRRRQWRAVTGPASSLFTAMVFASLVSMSLPQPAAASDPIHLLITNVRDTSFVVSWLTAQAEVGQVRLADGKTFEDDRGANTETRVHYITVAGLPPEGTYEFDVVSGGETFDNEGAHWTVKTGATLEAYPPDMVSGRIRNPDGSNASDVIVFFAIDRTAEIDEIGVSAPLSTLVTAKDDGVFRTNLREIRARLNPSQYYAYPNAYTAEQSFRTLLYIGAEGIQGTGLAELRCGEPRLRSSDPAQWIVIDLSKDVADETDDSLINLGDLSNPYDRFAVHAQLPPASVVRLFPAAAAVFRL